MMYWAEFERCILYEINFTERLELVELSSESKGSSAVADTGGRGGAVAPPIIFKVIFSRTFIY